MLAYMDWASGEAEEPHAVTDGHFGRAEHLVETYLLPMARRAYADASGSKKDRAARRLAALIREEGWRTFTSRQAMRMERAGLSTASDLNPALDMLEEADLIRAVTGPTAPQGGRPTRLFLVHPAMHGGE